jgi:hypothetical protein
MGSSWNPLSDGGDSMGQVDQPVGLVFKQVTSGFVIELAGAYLGLAPVDGSILFGTLDRAQYYSQDEIEAILTPSSLAKPGTRLQSALLKASFKKVEIVTYYKVEK